MSATCNSAWASAPEMKVHGNVEYYYIVEHRPRGAVVHAYEVEDDDGPRIPASPGVAIAGLLAPHSYIENVTRKYV